MLNALSRSLFLALARRPVLASLLVRGGMRRPDSFVRRFVGGETIAELVSTLREIDGQGFTHTFNHLGEHVQSAEAARAAVRDYVDVIDAVAAAGMECKVSVKLSQIGLELDRGLCLEHLRQILVAADRRNGFVRVDMEGSRVLDDTLDVFDTVWGEGHRNVGVVLQAYLRRTEADLRRVIERGGRVRLCKGAYNEPSTIAFRSREDVDAAFIRLMRLLLSEGTRPAIATHDPHMIDATRTFAHERGVAPRDFEFQMLYGVRRDLQEALRDEGYTVRIYVPFGPEWYPYFMRRLAERPENVRFLVRSLIDEYVGRPAR
ncbi:MAG: proline dehydrogenase family protein [Acidobacteria bacterium]|nr:proline dehydrogenase family protein [Acidobacteriota bacterium]